MFKQTKALCDTFLKMGIPGLDLMVYKDGECAFRYTKGYADPENKTPMTGKEKYHIYSASKLFTCVAANPPAQKTISILSLYQRLRRPCFSRGESRYFNHRAMHDTIPCTTKWRVLPCASETCTYSHSAHRAEYAVSSKAGRSPWQSHGL